MNYKIVELDKFEVMGKKYKLSNSLGRNMKLAQKHWMNFNNALRKNNVHLGRNWIKYAFIIYRNSEMNYYIAVPKKDYLSNDFEVKTIPKSKYIMVKHIGNMNKLKNTIDYVYEELISKNNIILKSNECFYFEKYDYKFHWNRIDSVIEIYFPIM